MTQLFNAIKVGDLALKNRIFMAPMTRGRASPDGTPTDPMTTYYALRADAGLVLTEGVCVSPRALGWSGAPGIYSDLHVSAWRAVTDAVHARGGHIFAQLWFLGRVSHPVFLNGAIPWGPSAVRPQQHVHAADGTRLPCVTPVEMTREDIVQAVDDFAEAARHARVAGFDGVQIHAANGYLIDQFLRDGSNHRQDVYGGSIERRLRFLLEVVEACSEAVGNRRVAVRLSPLNAYNDMSDSDPASLFAAAAAALNGFDLAFLEVVEGLPGHFLFASGGPLLPNLREIYNGVLVANAGYQFDSATQVVARGTADAVAFGVPFISNPDLVARWREGLPLSAADPGTFYTPGEPGYLDYPTHEEQPATGDTYQGLSLDEARKH